MTALPWPWTSWLPVQ